MPKANSKTILAFGDVHIPHQNAAALEVFCKVAEYFKPEMIICLGDLLDCGQFSTHPPTYGMYRQFLADAKTVNPHIRVIGLTATPYRLKGGLICKPDHFLNHVCYEIGVKELIVQGYLCPLKSKAGKSKANLSNLHVRGGEFVASEIEAAMDNHSLVQSACEEIVELTADRNSVLIFSSGVSHGRHIARAVSRFSGQECGFVCGETPGLERESLLQRFKAGELKYLTNVNVLTTGFDAPNIDCVVLLRPTNSPGLYYQMVGRGFRLHPDKADCLILDYGGNIIRHGPVDDLKIKEPGQSGGEAPAKECPECGCVFPPPEREKHDAKASSEGVLSGEVTETRYDVTDVLYNVHVKRGAPEDHPKTMRVDYRVDFGEFRAEWICLEHTGYARGKAEAWWRARSNEPVPGTVEEAVAVCYAGGIAPTQSVTVRSVTGEKYDRIIAHSLGPIPPRRISDHDDSNLPDYSWAGDEIPF